MLSANTNEVVEPDDRERLATNTNEGADEE